MSDRTLDHLAAAGYITGQQGQCGTYACALLAANPNLRLGSLGEEAPGDHFVAHDDSYAYDSAGRHPLPYRGVAGDLDFYPDVGTPEDWGLPDDEHGPEGPAAALAAAADHSARHRILTRTPTRAATKDLS